MATSILVPPVRRVRAANPPMPFDEIVALKRAVAVLATLGRALAQLPGKHQISHSAGDLYHTLNQLRVAVAGTGKLAHDLARAALLSWEAPL